MIEVRTHEKPARYCLTCKLSVADNSEICPLCRCALTGDMAKNSYPDVKIYERRLNMAIRIYLLVAIMMELICVYLNNHYFHRPVWSWIIGGSLLYVYIVLRFGIQNRNTGYATKLFVLTLLGFGYAVMIDRTLGNVGWSLNLAYPLVILALDATIAFSMIYNRRNWQSFALPVIIVLLLSILGLLFVLWKIIKFELLTVIAFWVSLAIFLGTFLLGGRKVRAELTRRFHFR